jgi:hypothetical protein
MAGNITPEIRAMGQLASRFRAAEKRIRCIAEGTPALTLEQRQYLAAVLLGADWREEADQS